MRFPFPAALLATLATWSPAAGAGCPLDGTVDYEVIPLTGLQPRTFAVAALNDSGEVAGLLFPANEEPARVFVWRNGNVAMRDLPGPGASVLGMNENGVVVGVGGQSGPRLQ